MEGISGKMADAPDESGGDERSSLPLTIGQVSVIPDEPTRWRKG
jgi:hypothetical protein